MSGFERTESGFQFVDEDAILTPADTDRFLKRLNNELGLAQLEVRKARRQELDRTKAYMEARAPLLLDEDCPDVGRAAGQVSARERDAWFSIRIPEEFWALKEATLDRTNATDYLWQVKDQVRVMQSLNKNAKALFDTHRDGQ